MKNYETLGRAALLLLASALACGGATAQATKAAAKPAQAQTWTAWGGTVGLRWNVDLARNLGIAPQSATLKYAQKSERGHEMFDLRQAGSLEFDVRSGSLAGFLGGTLQARGGHVLEGPSGRIDLTDFRLVPRRSDPLILDVVGADGRAWFYVDRLMYELIDNNQRLAVRAMDVRISPELARRIGHPHVANWVIGDMQMTTEVLRQGSGAALAEAASFKWHGTPAPDGVSTYQVDLFMQGFTVQFTRCPDCTGEGGSGRAVFTPSSTLRNNVNGGSLQATIPGDPLGTSNVLWAADIPWWSKFSGSNPPYNNDQHPYLIWNLYRVNADGTIDQIGRSGVKHAFLTVNNNCVVNPSNNHVLGQGCSDTYGMSNNDSNNDLGPRSEVIPHTNVWGRCGSIFDPNCDGSPNPPTTGEYDYRLAVRESQFSGPAQAGATYFFESWYLAREDVNILNSMGSQDVTFQRYPTVWYVNGGTYRLGPAIDRWVNPANPGPNASSTLVQTREGSIKVAAKATDLGGGRWRYDYAVMNLDFSRPRTEGTAPNLRVISNAGFDNFSVPIGTASVSDLVFSDGDLDAGNDWSSSVRDGRLYFTTSSRGNTLNWGTMFRFSFVANKAPAPANATLHIAAENTRETLLARDVIAPGATSTAAAAQAAPAAKR